MNNRLTEQEIAAIILNVPYLKTITNYLGKTESYVINPDRLHELLQEVYTLGNEKHES